MSGDGFFDSKRAWSNIKDEILVSYLPPYFAKLRSDPRRRFLIIDAFAGRGRFEDGTPGSPILICSAAEKYVPNRYEAIFINVEREHHEQLKVNLQEYPGAHAVHGDSREVLKSLHARLTEPLTIFLYLDPFGIKEINFDLLEPFIKRNPTYSTEIVVNLQMPVLHRLAARDAYLAQPDREDLKQFHIRLSHVLGGDYWRTPLLFEANLSTQDRERQVIDGYRDKLSSTGYLTYTGACPIRQSRTSQTKYYMIFASRHTDAMILFNDNMIGAFERHMTHEEFKDTLFADLDWRTWRAISDLEPLVVAYVKKHAGKSRQSIWGDILLDHFMRFSEKEYRDAVKMLVSQGVLSFESSTGRLNDECKLSFNQPPLIP